jgi:quinol monooxygenase YgiN
MIIIAGTIDFESQEARDAAVAKAVPYQESTRADEAGCLGYSFAPDSGCTTRVQVFELWEDEASLAAHFEHRNFIERAGPCGAPIGGLGGGIPQRPQRTGVRTWTGGTGRLLHRLT